MIILTNLRRKRRLRQWVKALRSGEYSQTLGDLSRDGKYCCLGVLCEVAISNGISLDRTTGDGGIVKYDTSTTMLPISVRRWVYLNSSDPWIDDGFTATEANDTFKLNFEEIADKIEKFYKL